MSEDTDGSDDDIGWQVVALPTLKRRQTKSPTIFQNKRIYIDNKNSTTLNDNKNNLNGACIPNINNNVAGTSKQAASQNSNRFAALDNENDEIGSSDEEMDNTDTEQNDNNDTVPKPPPIFIPFVADVSKMIESFSKIIPSDDFNYKSLRDGQIRLMIKNIKSYRLIVTYLNNKKLKFHTYQVKQERSYRVVVKNLHHSTPIGDIKSDIEIYGHKVRNITNLQSRITKVPLPIFYIDLEPATNNKSIYDIKYINNAIVNIEPPKKKLKILCNAIGVKSLVIPKNIAANRKTA